MKKETDKNKTTYEITINKKALDEIVQDILKYYQSGKKITVQVSV